MASYATVPATDLESEATLLNSKPKTKTSLLVGGVAAAAFVTGVLSMTALRTSPSGVLTRTATSLSACDGGPLAVGDAVELQNLNAAPALNGKAGVITAINGGITTVKMDDGGSVRNVPSVKVKAFGCPDDLDSLLDKQDWTNPICCNAYWGCKLAFDTTRSGQCLGWCGVSSTATQAQCIGGDEVKEKREGCCADQPPCPRKLPACKF